MALVMLQMEPAKADKEQALAGINEIGNEQARKKECAEALNTAHNMKSRRCYLNSWGYEDHILDSLKKFGEGEQ